LKGEKLQIRHMFLICNFMSELFPNDKDLLKRVENRNWRGSPRLSGRW